MTLSDGTKIDMPANSIAVTGTVTVRATPRAQLPSQQTSRPVSVGYDLAALDSTGRTITNFSSDVYITLKYDKTKLPSGVSEDDLVPSYWDSTTSTWKKASNVVIDKDASTVTIITNHFTDFAIVAAAFTPTGYKTYLPLIFRAYSAGW